MARPRLIPVPDSPPVSAKLPPGPSVGDKGPAPSSFDRNCASPQAPVTDITNYDQLSRGQLHELRRQRGRHKKGTEPVLRTCLAAMDAASKKTADGVSGDIYKSTTVLGKRARIMGDTMDAGTAVGGNTGNRPRSDALGVALAVDLKVVKEHAQWWNPELRPQVDAHHSSGADGANGALSDGLPMIATRRWAGRYRQRKRNSMRN